VRRKLRWLDRYVNGDEVFDVPELPDDEGNIKYPTRMTTINLLGVLKHEPLSSELENIVRMELAEIAELQVFIGLMAEQVAPEVAEAIGEIRGYVKAFAEKYLRAPKTRLYAEAEKGALKRIQDLHEGTVARYVEEVSGIYYELDGIVELVRSDMKDLIPLLQIELTYQEEEESYSELTTATETSTTDTEA
jgi:hypothetical protein